MSAMDGTLFWKLGTHFLSWCWL